MDRENFTGQIKMSIMVSFRMANDMDQASFEIAKELKSQELGVKARKMGTLR